MSFAHPEHPRDVVVVGAGPMGRASAAWLAELGHRPALWSPRRRAAASAHTIDCEGAIRGRHVVRALATPAELAAFDTVLVCLPGNAYEPALGELAPLWRDGQTVIVSGALSLVGLWLATQARQRGVSLRVLAWNTTLTTAHDAADGRLHVNPLRQQITVATAGDLEPPGDALALCCALFGDRFAHAESLLVPLLANINPIAHAAEVIPNLTRMDRSESWPLFGCFTPVVGRLAQALDDERLAVARAYGFELPSLRTHYACSYLLDRAPLHEMAAEIERRGMGPRGPARLDHRYVLEDAPFGLATLETLARLAGVPTPALSACITLLQVVYARDFRAEDFLPGALGLSSSSAAALRARCVASRNAATSGERAAASR